MAWLRRNSARAAVLVVIGVVALNLLGVLRYPGGPLRESNADGDQGFAALAVDYRVGPFSFRVIQHFVVSLCVAPLPPQQGCTQE